MTSKRIPERMSLLVAICLSLAMLGAAWAAHALRPTQRLADAKTKIDLERQIPRNFGNWTEDLSITPVLPNPEVQARLDALYSSTLARTYRDAQGHRVMLSIAYGSDQGSEATAVHRPEFCYSAQGFSVTGRGDSYVELEKHRLPVRRIVGVMSGRVEPITYWVTLDETVTLPGVGRKLAQLEYGLHGQIPDGLLFRVSSIGKDESENFHLQEGFLRDLSQHVDPQVRARYFGK